MGSLGKSEIDDQKKAQKEARDEENNPSLTVIFKYADGVDYLLMLLGTLGALGDGMSTNCILVFASRLMNSLGYGQSQLGNTNFMREVAKVHNNFQLLYS